MRRGDPIRRIGIGLLAMTFVLSLFVGRLVQLQGLESTHYAKMAERQRVVDMRLPALRGAISDANGHPLAVTVEARAVYVDPGIVEPGQRAKIATSLSDMLGVPANDILAKLAKPTRFEVIAHGVPPDKARAILALNLRGVATQLEYSRVYPNGSLAANVLGFVGRDGYGLGGVESGLNDQLAGRDGSQRVEIGRKGQPIPMAQERRRPPQPGRDVRLTLDSDIQWKAQSACAEQARRTHAESCTAVVLDPHTGRILALATAPTFDPNNLDQATPVELGDRPVGEVYEPGSTNKVITVAAAMEELGLTPHTPFTVPYSIERGGRMFHDAEGHATERLTLAGILARSSNVGVIEASDGLTSQQLYHYLQSFGFGRATGLGLPGESPGILPPPDRWWGSQRYTIAFGQGVSVNAVQMASVYATIANGGVRVAPRIVDAISDGGGKFVPLPPPQQPRRVISARTASELVQMLEGVTTMEGTAPKAQIPGYRVAGKTGTANRFNAGCGCYRGYTATFVGFAPADRPDLVVEVVLQNPRMDYFGGAVAAPVFRDIMTFALKSRKVPPSGTTSPSIPIYAR